MTVLRMLAALLAGYAFGWPRSNVSGPRPGQSAAAAIADPRAPAELPPDRGERERTSGMATAIDRQEPP